jgi:hypothetical protein
MIELNSGNFIDYAGPLLTPYALAISDAYEVQVPLFMTVPTTLGNVTREEKVVITDPFQHDCLIIGAHINIGSTINGDSGQSVILNVSDLTSGLLWALPSPLSGSPATAFGGSQFNAMPFIKLPEAFFLPAHTRLKHLWRVLGLATGGSITWVGLQLFKPKSGKTPTHVKMPDGSTIRVGSRIPWFCSVGLGTEISVLGSINYAMEVNRQYVQFTTATDCDVEIHDVNANWFTQNGISQNPTGILLSIGDKGQPQFWQPSRSPATALMGDFNKALPAMPFTKPYLQKAGDRLQLKSINQSGLTINNAIVTFRGVQLCTY